MKIATYLEGVILPMGCLRSVSPVRAKLAVYLVDTEGKNI
jgi:hypothetical protein